MAMDKGIGVKDDTGDVLKALLIFPPPYGRGVKRYNFTVAPILRGEMENRG